MDVDPTKSVQLGDNCIQNFHLGRYIVVYIVGNLVLRQRASRAVKHDFQRYIQRYASPNENFEYGYPHTNALLQSRLKLEHCKPHKSSRHPTKCEVSNNVKLFRTVYLQDILSQIFDIIQSNVALHKQVH